jgi:transposase
MSIIEHRVESKKCSCEHTIKQEIMDGNVASFDETGTRSEKRILWVHVAVNPNFSHFSIHNKRGFDGMVAGGILPNFKGTAVHDFFKPYLKFECEHSFCNAHLLRELIGAQYLGVLGILRVEISFVDYVPLLIHARNRNFQF